MLVALSTASGGFGPPFATTRAYTELPRFPVRRQAETVRQQELKHRPHLFEAGGGASPALDLKSFRPGPPRAPGDLRVLNSVGKSHQIAQ
jgi:hypothetical protein